MTISQQILKELNLQPGDKVKITHKVPSGNLGWTNSWLSGDMDKFIGQVLTVKGVVGVDIHFKETPYGFPPQCIEIVERKPKLPTIKIEGTEVYRSAKFDVVLGEGDDEVEIEVYYQEDQCLDIWRIESDNMDKDIDNDSELGKAIIEICKAKLAKLK
jgi:hypothetical protein